VREREIEGEREIKKKIICGKSSHVSTERKKIQKAPIPPSKKKFRKNTRK
jgi:hypothetical protein